jgi:hypothetical protein
MRPRTLSRLARRASRFFVFGGLVLLLWLVSAPAFAASYDPSRVVSDDNFRDYASMNQADIQAFLQSSPALASYEATDYPSGKRVLASQIVYNAAQNFRVNPRIILCMLQKEQSLLTRSQSSLATGDKATLDWAMGMGCPDHAPRIEAYRGFGTQVWAATWSLDAYGEKGKKRPFLATPPAKQYSESGWKAGDKMSGIMYPVAHKPTKSDGSDYHTATTTIAPKNLATFKLLTYNPSIGAMSPYGDLSSQAKKDWMGGNANFWLIYRRYFGDTFANPRLRPVERFRDKKTGAYLYTASPAEQYGLQRWTSRYANEGVAFSWDTSSAANNIPVDRFMNRKSRGYMFTGSKSLSAYYRSAKMTKTWRYEGVAFFASGKVSGARAVYQFNNRKTGLPFLTTSSAEKSKFSGSTYRKKWKYKGVVYYIAP